LNKKKLIPLTFLAFIILAYLGLNYSSRLNNLIFSKIVNSYDPLLAKISQSKVSQITKEKVDTSEYWKDPRDLFPIFAYDVPDKTKDLSASLRIIEKGGINILINGNLSWMPAPYKVKEAFEKLGNSKLKWLAIITNECNDDYITANSNDETNIQIKNYLKAFNDNYVYGWNLWDEPGRNRKSCTPLNLVPNDDNADINRMVKQIRSDSVFNKKLDFVNLFPTYWEGTPDVKAYENYIDAFISSQEFKPRVLCFDHYPLLKREFGGFRKDYYSNLDIIRKKSIEYNIPFWMIIISSEHLSYKKPTFEEIRFQVYSALAYGAKGIGYYLYSKSWEEVGYRSWILENFVDNDTVVDSLHGPFFVPVKRLNEEIQTLGKTLLTLESIEIIHSSDYPNNQKDISQTLFKRNQSNSLIQEILNNGETNADPKILIGVFNKKNSSSSKGKYLLIVNKDVRANSNFTITLNNSYYIFKFAKETGDSSQIENKNTISLQISPGSGELFYIE